MSSFQAPLPRVALFNTNTVYSWSDTTPFTGFFLIEMLLPSDGVTPWSEVDYGNLFPGLTLPKMQKIPVVDGQANGACGLFLNGDLTPPGSKYVYWTYDSTGRQLNGPSAAFTVTTANLPAGVTVPSFVPPTIPSTTAPVVTPDTVSGIQG